MMKRRFTSALVLGTILVGAGCVGTSDVSRDVGFDVPPTVENIVIQDWDVVGVEVNVPRTLSVSEANKLKPRADIVWHEDPMGDRHSQVDDLITAALEPAFEPLEGSIPVIVNLEVTLFHAQTHRVRYSSIPSRHEIEFVLTVSHAETGELLSGPRDVDLTFPALNDSDAIAADTRGETQRVRITARFQEWVEEEFVGPVVPDTLLAAAP